MSGATGQLAMPNLSAFSISNYAIEGFSDALRLEMKQFGIKVVVVEPGNYFGSTGLQNRAAVSVWICVLKSLVCGQLHVLE